MLSAKNNSNRPTSKEDHQKLLAFINKHDQEEQNPFQEIDDFVGLGSEDKKSPKFEASKTKLKLTIKNSNKKDPKSMISDSSSYPKISQPNTISIRNLNKDLQKSGAMNDTESDNLLRDK